MLMKENIDKAIEWLKKQPIKGCITGSSLLGYFEGQDVDIFVYDEKSFTNLIYAMHYNNDFQILDPLEKWKFEKYIKSSYDNFRKLGLITIKFTYNTCIPVNVILKKNCSNIFEVLSSFDMNIIAKGYDIETQQYLDLSGSTDEKIATWNRWNPNFYNPELWQINRLLRQLERVFKYHKRGYNTDLIVYKYIELIDQILELEDIFNSNNYTERLKIIKNNTVIIKQICEIWLDTHQITDEQLELFKIKIKEIQSWR